MIFKQWGGRKSWWWLSDSEPFWALGSPQSLILLSCCCTREALQSIARRWLCYGTTEQLERICSLWVISDLWNVTVTSCPVGVMLELFQTLVVQRGARFLGIFSVRLDTWNTVIHWNRILIIIWNTSFPSMQVSVWDMPQYAYSIIAWNPLSTETFLLWQENIHKWTNENKGFTSESDGGLVHASCTCAFVSGLKRDKQQIWSKMLCYLSHSCLRIWNLESLARSIIYTWKSKLLWRQNGCK